MRRLAALLLLLPTLPMIAAAAAGPGARAKRPFQHRSHVPQQWLEGAAEVARDCRRCHRYDLDPPGDPQPVCDACHLQPGRGTFRQGNEAGFADGLAPLRSGGLYRHSDHLKLACRECHRPERTGPGLGSLDPLPIRRGAGYCLTCHDAGGRRDFEWLAGAAPEGDLEQRLVQAFRDRLNDDPSMTPSGLGPFRHRDHVADVDVAQGIVDLRAGKGACAECHAPLTGELRGALGAAAFDAATSCARCHRDQQAPLAFTTARVARPSEAAATFAHGDHLAGGAFDAEVCAQAAHDELAARGCASCHRATPPGPLPDWTLTAPVSGPSPAAYEGCVRCHDLAAWRTAEHARWVERRCVDCHVFGGATERMADDRPMVEGVRRRAGARFRFPSQAHPHITAADRAQADASECVECHVAPVGALPSRLSGRVFRHDTHLPGQGAAATAEHCARCHPAALVADTRGPDLVGQAVEGDAALRRTFDLGVCADCHRGAPVVEVVAEAEPTAHPVVRFGHADHVGVRDVRGDVLACGSCHDSRAGEAAVGVRDGARQCRECHDHAADGQLFAQTGEIRGSDVESCARCHRDAVPLPDQRTELAVQAIAGIGGTQFHPRRSSSCATCHRPGVETVKLRDHVYGVAANWNPRGLGDRHLGNADKEDDRRCIECHWAVINSQGVQVTADDRRRRGADLSFPDVPGLDKKR